MTNQNPVISSADYHKRIPPLGRLLAGLGLFYVAVLVPGLAITLTAQQPVGYSGGGDAMNANTQSVTEWHGWPVLPALARLRVPINKTEAEWRKILTPMQFKVLRQEATEAACSGAYWNEHRPGMYYSAATGQPLFTSDTKFESGSGWPSFFQPVSRDAIILRWDYSLDMERIEVLDSSSGSHLGHVFDDGPTTADQKNASGLRFCMNSEALIFVPDGQAATDIVRNYRGNPVR